MWRLGFQQLHARLLAELRAAKTYALSSLLKHPVDYFVIDSSHLSWQAAQIHRGSSFPFAAEHTP